MADEFDPHYDFRKPRRWTGPEANRRRASDLNALETGERAGIQRAVSEGFLGDQSTDRVRAFLRRHHPEVEQ